MSEQGRLAPRSSSTDDCVGSRQFGSPDELPRIKNRAAYEREKGHPRTGGSPVASSAKGTGCQGVASAAVVGALNLIAEMGGGVVEGYPEDVGSGPAGFLYNGALSTYERLGFAPDRKIGKHRWVVTTTGQPK